MPAASLTDAGAAVTRAGCLVVLAEIITRWPALLGVLRRRDEHGSGFGALAEAAGDDARWRERTRSMGVTAPDNEPALADLRHLLRTYDGRGIAELADRLL
ncbi:hypothetical protein ACYF6T_11635 [Streptomyces sp. 7R007]